MSKGPEAFRTISEVAEELALPQHVLRFWETRFTSIKPMKRGGGRRYYRPDDVDLLRGIRALLYGEGYTIRGVQRILKEQGPRSIIAAARGRIVPMPAPQPRGLGSEDTRVEVVTRAGVTARVSRPALPPEVVDDEFDDEVAVRVEPAFVPKEFRPAVTAPPQAPSAARPTMPSGPVTLSAEDVRRLQATLANLLELKRLLDSTRE